MIKIKSITLADIEALDNDNWNYPIFELDYLVEINEDNDKLYGLWEDRLYEL